MTAAAKVHHSVGDDAPHSTLYNIWVRDWTQVLIISFICFCCPGMFNALSGVGGGGQVTSTVSANASVALSAVSSVFNIFIVPPLFDLIGARWCLLIGGWTYPLYCGAQLCFAHTGNAGFVIASGAIIGAGSAFLWIPQGAIMTSLVPRNQIGRAIGTFWVIFNLGGSVGGFMSMGLNWNSTAGNLNDSTYAAYIAVQCVGWLCMIFICKPEQVLRADGTHPPIVHLPKSKQGTLYAEAKSLMLLFMDYKVLCLIPMFFSANFFYSYQQNNVNADSFTVRGRSLNSAIYWCAQMFGGIFIGFLLDTLPTQIGNRARIAWAFCFVYCFVIWGCGFKWQTWFDAQNKGPQWIDVGDNKTYMAGFWLYFAYGFMDAVWQSFSYWCMGALSTSSNTAARFIGIYKCMVGVGGACAGRINALAYPAKTQLIINWALVMFSLVAAVPTILSISETSEVRQAHDLDAVKDDIETVTGDTGTPVGEKEKITI